MTTARLLKYISQLNIIAEMLGSDFTVIDKDDMYELVGKMERSDRSDWTKHDYKVTIKRFFRWVNEEKILNIQNGSSQRLSTAPSYTVSSGTRIACRK